MSHLAKDMTPSVTWKEITPGCNIFEGGTSHVIISLLAYRILRHTRR